MTSFFIITFKDGSSIHSDSISWHACSEKMTVIRQGKPYLVYANITPIIVEYINHLSHDHYIAVMMLKPKYLVELLAL